MFGPLKKEYEISTSMSEDHIVEELKAMKRKFLPIGVIRPESFSLMVLADSHRSGRRRTGGFVQLTGTIRDEGERRVMQIKTGSGAGFLVPMMMVVFFLLIIAGVWLAGNGNPELLFPTVFLIAFSLVLIYMRRTNGEKAEAVLREHFEGTDRATEFFYITGYTKEQCMEFMPHENVEDVYEYQWRQEKKFGALIIKDYKTPNHIHDFDGRQEWGFIVRFHEQSGDKTRIEVQLVQTEKLPYIHNKAKVDIFWKNKLGAIAT